MVDFECHLLTLSTIRNPDTSGFQIPTVYIFTSVVALTQSKWQVLELFCIKRPILNRLVLTAFLASSMLDLENLSVVSISKSLPTVLINLLKNTFYIKIIFSFYILYKQSRLMRPFWKFGFGSVRTIQNSNPKWLTLQNLNHLKTDRLWIIPNPNISNIFCDKKKDILRAIALVLLWD